MLEKGFPYANFYFVASFIALMFERIEIYFHHNSLKALYANYMNCSAYYKDFMTG